MMTSWNETEQIEAHLLGRHNTGEALLFEARLLLNPELSEKILWQNKTYTLIQTYSRNQLKREIEAVHQKLFTQAEHSSFSQKIRRLFTKK
ncbi:MAG: hypothetical protein ABI203_10670 [Mucilaginibacter sp.]